MMGIHPPPLAGEVARRAGGGVGTCAELEPRPLHRFAVPLPRFAVEDGLS